MPIDELAGVLGRDDAFVGHLRGVIAGTSSAAAVARRYVPPSPRAAARDARRQWAMETLIEEAATEVTRIWEAYCDPARSSERTFRGVTVTALASIGSRVYWAEEPMRPGMRRRIRSGSLGAAVDLAARGAEQYGACIAPGCVTVPRSGSCCAAHERQEAALRRARPARLEALRDLLDRVADALEDAGYAFET